MNSIFLDDIIVSIFTLVPFMPIDVIRSRDLVATYRDLDLGLADAAGIATAERLGVNRILAVDEHEFRAVRSADGNFSSSSPPTHSDSNFPLDLEHTLGRLMVS